MKKNPKTQHLEDTMKTVTSYPIILKINETE